MEEIWRDIKGYEGLYKISSYGRVYSHYKKDCLKPGNNRGYLYVNLYKKGKNNTCKIHRLVAEAFILNPNNYEEVNHKDENKQNNRVENLEWCDRKYNANYGTINKRISENHKLSGRYKGSKNPKSHKVICITTNKKFNTIKEASEYYSANRHSIGDCCSGKRKSAGKHPITGEKLIWKYIEEVE